jgi:hypothetical protein
MGILTCSGWPANKKKCTHVFEVCADVVDGKVPKSQFNITNVSHKLSGKGDMSSLSVE